MERVSEHDYKNYIIVALCIVIIILGVGFVIFFVNNRHAIFNKKNIEGKNNSSINSSSDDQNEVVDNDSNSSNDNSTDSNEENQLEFDDVSDDKAIAIYISTDSLAMRGHPNVLYIYRMTDSEIDFKYHVPTGEVDVKGTAKMSVSNFYVYSNGDKKIELVLNSLGEDSIEVTVYDKNEITLKSNLFKNSN